MKKLLSVCLLLFGWHAAAEDVESLWQADGGALQIHFFYDMLQDFDVSVKDGLQERHDNWEENQISLNVTAASGLNLIVPRGGLKGIKDGVLYLNGGFSWQHNGTHVMFQGLNIKPTTRSLKAGELTALEISNDTGEVLLLLDSIHAHINDSRTAVEFNHMDIRVSDVLAQKLGAEYLAGMVVGNASMVNHLVVPADFIAENISPLGACVADDWPGPGVDADIQLIDMTAQYVRSIGEDQVVFTPNATLENIGQADVAWYRFFSGNFPPYNNDQHPYLTWAMYREIDGRFEQIGVSGVKHAFYTVNSNCPCAGGQVIFPTCTDLYSVNNNDSGYYLGPRSEISVFDGNWQSTGSFFDQDGNGVHDNSSNGTDENRMVVDEIDFQDDQLNYYISSWYTVRDDVDIFNSMGYRQYQFNPTINGWTLTSLSAFNNGPASDQYVAPNSFDLIGGTASSRILQEGEGHLTVAVKVVDLGGGLYRYNYMVENHDYDSQVQTIKVPLSSVASMTNFVFSDVDSVLANDWTVQRNGVLVTLQAPSGNAIDWGTLYSFSFTTDAAPQTGGIYMRGLENSNNEFNGSTIVPYFEDLIFMDDFENLN